MTFSRTVISGNGRGIWKVRASPLAEDPVRREPVDPSPSRMRDPEVGGNRPARQLKRVVLPAPFGPISPVIVPLSIVNGHLIDGAIAAEGLGDRLGCQHEWNGVPDWADVARAAILRHENGHVATGNGRCPVADDSFELYDLRVEVVAPEGATLYCGAKPGDYFELKGEMLHLPPGQGFSIYSLAALLPLLPAKQRATHPNDWMSTDAEVACPDPNCPSRLPDQPDRRSASFATRR